MGAQELEECQHMQLATDRSVIDRSQTLNQHKIRKALFADVFASAA